MLLESKICFTFPLEISMKNDQIQTDEYGKVSNLS